MPFVGIVIILAGCQFVLSAVRRRKPASRDLWRKTDLSQPLAVRQCIAYSILGLALIALGLNYVIR